MFENLSTIEKNFLDLETKISDPEVMKDMNNWQKLVKEHADLKPIVDKYKEYNHAVNILKEDKEMLNEKLDDDMREMLKEEISTLEEDIEKFEGELKILLLPKDPNDHKNVFLEIRAGAGGDEAGLFAGELLRMYQMFADKQGWSTEIMEITDQGVGGIKEAVVMIKGNGAYSKLKYESGVHRVQRVPTTESSGRIHTSAATVAVLPEADDVDVQIESKDIRIDVFRSSGNGGQSVNTTDSAVRITHMPTGIVVSCQDEKSQLKNKDKAMKILKSRLYDQMMEEQNKDIADERKSQVGSGDRSERIRTYNFPQGRVTDHRINLTLYRLQDFLDGNIEEMLDSLITYDQTEKLKLVG
ncbi:MAG: peptide chain release factor 1 [Miniphocaeibacter sp.]|uniref:peptide chain release factor 1 n=1 Tax=Miniphocaeibacter sp. TaxID=3100973 RepID=UPI0017D6E4AE|nr:peptide chain release factor 1 [Gallicola sp.]